MQLLFGTKSRPIQQVINENPAYKNAQEIAYSGQPNALPKACFLLNGNQPQKGASEQQKDEFKRVYEELCG
ncbi:MAG: hypothetical protein VKJ06_08570 [Vampirovibrionales bacterium]|nr:hypothetical protein [Vampirovibrionales bacterium]